MAVACHAAKDLPLKARRSQPAAAAQEFTLMTLKPPHSADSATRARPLFVDAAADVAQLLLRSPCSRCTECLRRLSKLPRDATTIDPCLALVAGIATAVYIAPWHRVS